MRQYRLTADGLLHIRTTPACLDSVMLWLPLHAVPVDIGDAPILIDVAGESESGIQWIDELPPATATMGATRCHVDQTLAWIDGPGVRARVRLSGSRADVRIRTDAGDVDVISAMNFAAALLLARAGRYLMHCAAVVAPAGGVWLLAGDSGTGKTSTALGLARAGCGLLADDHVVLMVRGGESRVEGWPRELHVDSGWDARTPSGVRTPVDPRSRDDIVLAGPGPLRGILLPSIATGASRTTLAPLARADALAMLLRQSAWSVADRSVAPAALADLAAATNVPRFALRLARDTFASPERLLSAVAAALDTAGAEWSTRRPPQSA